MLANLGNAFSCMSSYRFEQANSQGTSSWSRNSHYSLVWFWPTQLSPPTLRQYTITWPSQPLTRKKVCSTCVNCTTWAQAAFNKLTMWSIAQIKRWLCRGSLSWLLRVAWHPMRLPQPLPLFPFTNPWSSMTNAFPATSARTWSPWTLRFHNKSSTHK